MMLALLVLPAMFDRCTILISLKGIQIDYVELILEKSTEKLQGKTVNIVTWKISKLVKGSFLLS